MQSGDEGRCFGVHIRNADSEPLAISAPIRNGSRCWSRSGVAVLNTRRSGSRFQLTIGPGSRRFTMSGRCCSVPCGVFLARDLVAVKEAPQRAVACQTRGAASAVLNSSSVMSGVSSPAREWAPARRSTRIERRSRHNRLRRRVHPFHRGAHSKTDRRLPTRQARQYRRQHPRPNVNRF